MFPSISVSTFICTCSCAVCIDGDVRIAAARTTSTTITGRVEVCLQNVWGTLCDDGWGNLDARVICRQEGYAEAGKA